MKFNSNVVEIVQKADYDIEKNVYDIISVREDVRATLSAIDNKIVGILNGDDMEYLDCIAKRIEYALDELEDAITDLKVASDLCRKVRGND